MRPIYTGDRITTGVPLVRRAAQNIKVLFDEARDIFAEAGCPSDDDGIVRLDPDVIAKALESAPEDAGTTAKCCVGAASFTPVTQAHDPVEERIPADVETVFDLQTHGPDVWVGQSPNYPWGRIFGGLVIAQALWAATQTIEQEHLLHSMHSYFILGGDPNEPVRYEVDRIRNGRSFSTRRVVARQSSGAIFNLSCSFQRHEDGVETQTADFPADAPEPQTLDFFREGSGVDRFDVDLGDQPRSLVWARFPGELADDPRVHLCALAYLSDTNAMDAVAHAHPRGIPETHDEWDQTYMSASLDHAMWFHRPVKANDWLLFDMDGHGILRTRGLTTGHVFAANGEHIATIAQEGLIREVR